MTIQYKRFLYKITVAENKKQNAYYFLISFLVNANSAKANVLVWYNGRSFFPVFIQKFIQIALELIRQQLPRSATIFGGISFSVSRQVFVNSVKNLLFKKSNNQLRRLGYEL